MSIRCGRSILSGFRLCVGLIIACGCVAVRATTVVPPDFDSLVRDADYIVRATVKSVDPEWRGSGNQRHIVTRVEIQIDEIIAGAPPNPLVLEMVGGKIGTDELVVEGAPAFAVGDQDILFVRGNGKQFYPLVALMYGKYPIVSDEKSGVRVVLRSNGNPLYNEKEVALPLHAQATEKHSVDVPPLSPEAFAQKIKASRQKSDALRQK